MKFSKKTAGASYFKCASGRNSPVEFTFDLLEKTGVMVVPGSSFGDRGEGYVRLAMVQPEEKIRKAIRVMDESGIFR